MLGDVRGLFGVSPRFAAELALLLRFTLRAKPPRRLALIACLQAIITVSSRRSARSNVEVPNTGYAAEQTAQRSSVNRRGCSFEERSAKPVVA